MQADGPLRSYHCALKDYAGLATPSQTDRFVHDVARLHLGYLGRGRLGGDPVTCRRSGSTW